MDTVESYRVLFKIYTSDCVFRQINSAFTTGDFALIEDYICSLIKCHMKFSKSVEAIRYDDYRVPVFRGVKDFQIDLDDY